MALSALLKHGDSLAFGICQLIYGQKEGYIFIFLNDSQSNFMLLWLLLLF